MWYIFFVCSGSYNIILIGVGVGLTFDWGKDICGMFAFHTNVGTLMVVSTIS